MNSLWLPIPNQGMIASLKSVSIVRTIICVSTELEQYNIDWECEMMAICVVVEVISSLWLYMPQLILHQFGISANKYLADTYKKRGNILMLITVLTLAVLIYFLGYFNVSKTLVKL